MLETAVRIAMEKGTISVTKELYPMIAAVYNDRPTRTERAIRHAIETSFDNADAAEMITKVFGNTVSLKSGKVTNSNYIYGVAKYIEVFCEEE